MSASLQVRALGVRRGARPVLHGIDLPAVEPGQVVALVGPNAAGKSTMLRALAGLLPATGTVRLGDADLLRLSARDRARLVGYMPQAIAGGIGLSVLESVIAAGPRDAQAMAVLDRLGIAELANTPLDRLSGGQRQVAGLAQAIARNPRLVLLDEPTSALDLARRHRVMQEVRALADEGRIVVAVLHDLALAAQWSDRVAVLDRGRLHGFGPPAATITPDTLRAVWHVRARVETCSHGLLQIITDAALPPPAKEPRDADR